MTKLPLENIERIVTADRVYNKVTAIEEVYSNAVAFYLVTYEECKRGAVRVSDVKNVDYREG